MKLTKQQREKLRGMFGGVCAYCGTLLGDKWHADHILPVRRNSEYITVYSLEEWRQKLQRSCAVLKNNQPTPENRGLNHG